MYAIKAIFTLFGSKYRITPKYPYPLCNTIIEPFAGSAGYSLNYSDRKVILVERDPDIVTIWQYLLNVTENEIFSLPNIEVDQSKWMCEWLATDYLIDPCQYWGPAIKERIASQLKYIRHWKIIDGDYTKAPSVKATWFIDPPYQCMGKYYRHGSNQLDYNQLSKWCHNRLGQIIVCETVGSDWLPFEHLCNSFNIYSKELKSRRKSKEAIWYTINGSLRTD